MRIYVDGACLKNPGGPGGWAVVLVSPTGSVLELSGGDPETTNNRMELTAALRALEASAGSVLVFSDSRYVVNGMTRWCRSWERRGWKLKNGEPVKNRDLWEALCKAAAGRGVEWRWLRGHAGHAHNERADALACRAAEAARPKPVTS